MLISDPGRAPKFGSVGNVFGTEQALRKDEHCIGYAIPRLPAGSEQEDGPGAHRLALWPPITKERFWQVPTPRTGDQATS